MRAESANWTALVWIGNRLEIVMKQIPLKVKFPKRGEMLSSQWQAANIQLPQDTKSRKIESGRSKNV